MTFFSALLAADAAKAAPANESLFAKFGVDGHHLAIQVVNFTILAVILYQFAIKPALGQLEERIRQAEQLQKDRAEAEAKLAAATKTAEDQLNKASDEAAKILAEARNSAKAAVEEAKALAVAAQVEVVAKAKADIEAASLKKEAELHAKLSGLVVETAAKVLAENLDDATRARLNEAAVKQLAR
jgi:F-type H+-transporting ATPase subunit b